MTVMGTIKNGVVILDADPVLADGTRVRVEPAAREPQGFTVADLDAIGRPILVEAYPGEFDAIYREMKEWEKAELRAQEEQDRNRPISE